MKYCKCDFCDNEISLEEAEEFKICFGKEEYDVCEECFDKLYDLINKKSIQYKSNKGTLVNLLYKYVIIDYIKSLDGYDKNKTFYIAQEENQNLIIFNDAPVFITDLGWTSVSGSSKLLKLDELASDWDSSYFEIKGEK